MKKFALMTRFVALVAGVSFVETSTPAPAPAAAPAATNPVETGKSVQGNLVSVCVSVCVCVCVCVSVSATAVLVKIGAKDETFGVDAESTVASGLKAGDHGTVTATVDGQKPVAGSVALD